MKAARRTDAAIWRRIGLTAARKGFKLDQVLTGKPGIDKIVREGFASVARTWTVTVTVKSDNGKPPIVSNIGGDTIFITLTENGQEATWKVKRESPGKKAAA